MSEFVACTFVGSPPDCDSWTEWASASQHKGVLVCAVDSPQGRLLVAAPALLAVLQEGIAQYGNQGGPWNVPSDPGGWISRARAVVKAATGEQP